MVDPEYIVGTYTEEKKTAIASLPKYKVQAPFISCKKLIPFCTMVGLTESYLLGKRIKLWV